MSALACYEQLKSHSLVREGDFTAMWFAFNCQCVCLASEKNLPATSPFIRTYLISHPFMELRDRPDH